MIKTTIEGEVDEIEQDALRMEYNSAHFADVQGVNMATGKVANGGFNGQGKTKKHSEKASKRRERDPCFRCGAVGHLED